MATLNDKIRQLENQIKKLQAKVLDLANKTEAVRVKPESKIPLLDLSKTTPMPSSGTGLGKLPARSAGIIWNDADAQNLGFGIQPSTPTKGYNKHSHSRYAGGALDINTLELVEYDFAGQNKHCQSYWKILPNIKKDDNGIEQISLLVDNMVWDKENQVWRFYAVYKD